MKNCKNAYRLFCPLFLCLSFIGACYGSADLKEDLPPIAFVFVNTCNHKGGANSPLSETGELQAIESGRLLKDFKSPNLVTSNFISAKETSKFVLEQLAIENKTWDPDPKKIGGYTPLHAYPSLDIYLEPISRKAKEKFEVDIRQAIIDIIKDQYSHERMLVIIARSDIFYILQNDLTDSNIKIKPGDVCVFTPTANKKWTIEYRPNLLRLKD